VSLKTYGISEDTLLLLETIRTCRSKVALELGIGSGVVTLELSKGSSWVVGCDLDIAALRETQQCCDSKENVELVCCDAASAFRERAFDLIVFNPPYLPGNETSDLATDGGMDGIEVTLKWIQSARQTLRRGGNMIFISSSLANRKELLMKIRNLGIEVIPLNKKKLFFEDLIAYKTIIPSTLSSDRPQTTQES